MLCVWLCVWCVLKGRESADAADTCCGALSRTMGNNESSHYDVGYQWLHRNVQGDGGFYTVAVEQP